MISLYDSTTRLFSAKQNIFYNQWIYLLGWFHINKTNIFWVFSLDIYFGLITHHQEVREATNQMSVRCYELNVIHNIILNNSYNKLTINKIYNKINRKLTISHLHSGTVKKHLKESPSFVWNLPFTLIQNVSPRTETKFLKKY